MTEFAVRPAVGVVAGILQLVGTIFRMEPFSRACYTKSLQ